MLSFAMVCLLAELDFASLAHLDFHVGCSIMLSFTLLHSLAQAAGIAIPRMTRSSVHYAVAIVGAIIMPHNIYLHSALVQSRYVLYSDYGDRTLKSVWT